MFELDPYYVLLGMVFGVMIMYVMFDHKIIMVKPKLNNLDKYKYIDDRGVCYKYYKKELK